MSRIRSAAVIPALNEEETIAVVVRAAKEHVDEVIVVDDASSDHTAALARNEGAKVISHPTRQGYDVSISDGFKLADANNDEIVVTMDADGQHVPSDIPRLIGPIEKREADIVVGRRPRITRVAETLFAAAAKSVLGIEDPLCGFKAYDMKVYRDSGHFDTVSSIGTQLMFEAKKRGYRLVQVDIELKEREDNPRFGGRIISNLRILRALIMDLILLVTE